VLWACLEATGFTFFRCQLEFSFKVGSWSFLSQDMGEVGASVLGLRFRSPKASGFRPVHSLPRSPSCVVEGDGLHLSLLSLSFVFVSLICFLSIHVSLLLIFFCVL